MRVVVTGGAGFIGSHVTDALLKQGHQVVVIDDLSTGRIENLSAATSMPGMEFIEADIASDEARRALVSFRPDRVLLLAAQQSVKVSMRDPLLDAHVNIGGLVTMLEAAREASVRKVVFAASGGTIYGNIAPESLPIPETCEGTPPSSFYGHTKRAGVEYLRLYRRHRGLDSVSLALGNVYGDRQDPNGEAGVVAIFLERLRRKAACVINGTGETTRDFVHVSDVVRAFLLAMDRGSGLINIGTGEETSVLDVHATLAGHFPDCPPPDHRPQLHGEVPRVSLDCTRARTQLGWKPDIDFPDGIAGLVNTSRG